MRLFQILCLSSARWDVRGGGDRARIAVCSSWIKGRYLTQMFSYSGNLMQLAMAVDRDCMAGMIYFLHESDSFEHVKVQELKGEGRDPCGSRGPCGAVSRWYSLLVPLYPSHTLKCALRVCSNESWIQQAYRWSELEASNEVHVGSNLRNLTELVEETEFVVEETPYNRIAGSW